MIRRCVRASLILLELLIVIVVRRDREGSADENAEIRFSIRTKPSMRTTANRYLIVLQIASLCAERLMQIHSLPGPPLALIAELRHSPLMRFTHCRVHRPAYF